MSRRAALLFLASLMQASAPSGTAAPRDKVDLIVIENQRTP